MMGEIQEHFLKHADYETDPEIISKGEEALHTALQVLQQHIDRAFTFVLYRFNRVAIKHDTLDAILTMDKDFVPTMCINYKRFIDMTLLCQIGTLEHMVGHLMSGHMSSSISKDMLEYCESSFGAEHGKELHNLVTESVADSFVTYPDALTENGRPYYDVTRLGMDRWAHTLSVLSKLEEFIEEGPPDADGDCEGSIEAVLQALAASISKPGDDTGDSLPMKDMVSFKSAKDSIMAEEIVREICKEAIKRNPSNSRGFMEGDASEFIKANEAPPVVPWHQRVNHLVTSGVSTERRITKKRLNRRNPEFGFGRVYMNVTTVAFVIDTSGSMGTDDLSRIDAELACIAQLTEQDIPVVHCDTGVAKCETYKRSMHLENFFGRGGTSFDPALEYIRDELPEMPDIIVYFTDGYGGGLDDDNPIIHPEETKLIWLLTPDGMTEDQFKSSITELGDVIKIESWT